MWDYNWSLSMHGWLRPICLIHPFRWKSLQFHYFIHIGGMVLDTTSSNPGGWTPEVGIGTEATGGNMMTSEAAIGRSWIIEWFPIILAVASNVVFLCVIYGCRLQNPLRVPASGNVLVFLIIVIFEAVTQGVNATNNEKTTTSVFLMLLCLLFFWSSISVRYDGQNRTQHRLISV